MHINLPRPPLTAATVATLATGIIVATFAANTVLFGGNWPLAQIATMFLLALAATLTPPLCRLPRPVLYGVAAPVALVLFWAALQCIPIRFLPTPFNLLLQPHPAFALVGNVPWAAAAINPAAGWTQLAYALALLLAAAGIFGLAAQPARAAHFRFAVALTAGVTAVYGLAIYIGGNHSVLWLPKINYLADLTATFINRNSYATFAGLGIIACLSLFFERLGEISARLTPRQRLRVFWLLVVRPRWAWLAAAFVLLVVLVLTHSRAGLGATAVGVLVLLSSLLWARRATRFIMAVFMILGLVAGISTLALVGDELGTRLSRLPSDQIARQYIYNLTEDAISQAAYTGQGLGGYAQAFRLIRSPESMNVLTGRVEHAHNTYLELATELGIPATLLLLVATITLVLMLARGLALRRRKVVWPATGLAALALVGTHGLFDFSLSIPAVALATLMLVAPAVAQSFPALQHRPIDLPRWHCAYWYPLVLGVAVFAAWLGWAAWPATRAASALARLDTGTQTLPWDELTRARHQFALGTRRNPANAAYWRGLAVIDIARADQTTRRGKHALLLASASQSLNRALMLNPADPASWYRLALINKNLPTRRAALLNSILTGPVEPVLIFARLPLELRLLPDAPPADAALIKAHLNQLWDAIPGPMLTSLASYPEERKTLGQVIPNTPANAEIWHSATTTPFPQAQPLGDKPQTR